jgi:hypothetical protein
LNRAVKRNSDHLPEDFMFQLTKVEHEILRCQIGISKNGDTASVQGGLRYMPVFKNKEFMLFIIVLLPKYSQYYGNFYFSNSDIDLDIRLSFQNHLLFLL